MLTAPVSVQLLDPRAKLPAYGSADAAGADLYAVTDGPVTIAPGQTALIHTGLALAIPRGYVGLIYARSGLATKQGLAPANKVGVIDADYRGELMVSLYNHSGQARTVESGDRVAQLVIAPYLTAQFQAADDLDQTDRGVGGFGSTGTK
jgi:dUTP pyrophosphatase